MAGPFVSVRDFAAAAFLTALTTYLLVVGEPILMPFVFAIFVSYFVSALASATGRLRIRGRPLPRGLRLGVAIVVLFVLGWLAVSLVMDNVGRVAAAAPVYEQNLRQRADQLGGRFGVDILSRIQALFEGTSLGGLVRGLARGLSSMLGSLGAVSIYVVFLLVERHSMDQKIAALFPDAAREALVHRILERIGKEIQSYVLYKTLFSAVTALASYAIMKAVGVDFAEFWSLLIFALNFIPYIGAWLGTIFPAVLTLVQFETLRPFLVVTFGLAAVQFLLGSIIEPRIMGSGLNLSPVVMLLSLGAWGTVWGIPGMFLAVPLMVAVMIVCSHFEATRPIAVLMSADGEPPR